MSGVPSIDSDRGDATNMEQIGNRAEQEVVTIDSNASNYIVGPFTNGVTTFNLQPAVPTTTPPTPASVTTKPHDAGTCVSNARSGNPGPQPTFNVNSSTYQPVVPYWSRVP